MKLPTHFLTLRTALAVLAGAALAGCGGGSTVESTPTGSMEGTRLLSTATSTYIPQSRSTATTNNTDSTAAAIVTDLRFESTTAVVQANVPVTFGQVFAPGHLSTTASLAGRLDNGAMVPLQLNVKALHADGSVRHAVISAVLPSLGAHEVRTMSLIRTAAAAETTGSVTPLLNAGFTASVNATIGGVRYTASANDLIKNTTPTTWLNGSTVNEWHVSAPLKNSAGVTHPHLSARFAVRWYDAIKKARVDVVVENNWAYEAAPQNFTYDAEVLVGGNAVYTKPAMTHYHHARWRKVFWWNGAAPEINVKHNTSYLIGTRAVPNYDQSLSIPNSALDALKAEWTGAKTEPMGVGLATPLMPMTGGRRDIGLLPGWTATYLLSMDQRARDVTLGTADLSGSWSSHYRDKQTGYPVSLVDYPYMTILGRPGDTWNSAAKRSEAFPACAAADLCVTPNKHDVSHQPNLAYVPYLLTGDYYYLEELQFWGMWSAFSSNPHYRGFEKGLLNAEQVRGQAWGLRTLAEAAYITPDAHPLKSHFTGIVDANLDWYNTRYAADAATSNALGFITNGYAIVYDNGTGVGPWQDDFFTSAVGHTAELGFTKAADLLKFKIKFPIERMVGEGACWIGASEYTMKVRDSSTSPLYTTISQVYAATSTKFTSSPCGSATMASLLGLKVGEMSGYPSAATGYPANLQPALAYAADAGGAAGAQAWHQFEQRASKPNYALAPQFAIKPR
ncbi:RIFT barrel domain-containing protein [Massilia consociata]|uniref:PcRGLX/YetA-like N-terminal RIFT barrel domain-containing protein n=1 Tax=Massilia consociata TaxID=760117 RepID=A0ABV6FBU9_9BURK